MRIDKELQEQMTDEQMKYLLDKIFYSAITEYVGSLAKLMEIKRNYYDKGFFNEKETDEEKRNDQLRMSEKLMHFYHEFVLNYYFWQSKWADEICCRPKEFYSTRLQAYCKKRFNNAYIPMLKDLTARGLVPKYYIIKIGDEYLQSLDEEGNATFVDVPCPVKSKFTIETRLVKLGILDYNITREKFIIL